MLLVAHMAIICHILLPSLLLMVYHCHAGFAINEAGCSANNVNRTTICQKWSQLSTTTPHTRNATTEPLRTQLSCPQPLPNANVLLICSAVYGRWDQRPCSTDQQNDVAEVGHFVLQRRYNNSCESRVVVTPDLELQCNNKTSCNISFAPFASSFKPSCSSVESPYVEIAYMCITQSQFDEMSRHANNVLANDKGRQESSVAKMAQQRTTVQQLDSAADRSTTDKGLLFRVTSSPNIKFGNPNLNIGTTTLKTTTVLNNQSVTAANQTTTAVPTLARALNSTSSLNVTVNTTPVITMALQTQQRRYNDGNLEVSQSGVAIAAGVGGAFGVVFCVSVVFLVVYLVRRQRRRQKKQQPINSVVVSTVSSVLPPGVGGHPSKQDWSKSRSLPVPQQLLAQQLQPQQQTVYAINNRFYSLSEKKFDRFLPMTGPVPAASHGPAITLTRVAAQSLPVQFAENRWVRRTESQSSGKYCDIGDVEQPQNNDPLPYINAASRRQRRQMIKSDPLPKQLARYNDTELPKDCLGSLTSGAKISTLDGSVCDDLSLEEEDQSIMQTSRRFYQPANNISNCYYGSHRTSSGYQSTPSSVQQSPAVEQAQSIAGDVEKTMLPGDKNSNEVEKTTCYANNTLAVANYKKKGPLQAQMTPPPEMDETPPPDEVTTTNSDNHTLPQLNLLSAQQNDQHDTDGVVTNNHDGSPWVYHQRSRWQYMGDE